MSKRKSTNGFFRISLVLFLYSVVIMVLCVFSTSFAELYSISVSRFLRYVFACFTDLVPFSVGEILTAVFLIAIFAAAVLFIVFHIKRSDKIRSLRCIFYGSLMLVFTLFINLFGICYFRNSLEDNLGITRKEMTGELLYNAASFVRDELEESIDGIKLNDNSTAENPYTFGELSKVIDKGYENLSHDYSFFDDFSSKGKPLLISPIMTYTHISGFYFPITGEANINTNYPDIVVAYSIAHEKAHQRGIASEDDANFVAFLALMYSEDPYLKYCALYNMYEYFLDALYKYDEEMFYSFLDRNHEVVDSQMREYREFFAPYSNSMASKAADIVNDTYIKTMGNSDGVESYGKVVELFASWF